MGTKIEQSLIKAREETLKKIKELLQEKALEAHISGSLARGDSDAYSDIDIWFTFKDEDMQEILTNRFTSYSHIGEIIHICEPPQNAPIGGVHSAILVIAKNGCISVADIYLCPLSTALTTAESKKLFGVDLPTGVMNFNSQKIQVDENYRIDFFISFIFNTIKKLARREELPLNAVFCEYENLYKKYNILVKPLHSNEQNITTLEEVIENIQKVANKRQKETLRIIRDFARKVLSK